MISFFTNVPFLIVGVLLTLIGDIEGFSKTNLPPRCSSRPSSSSRIILGSSIASNAAQEEDVVHPAVAGWPEKYGKAVGGGDSGTLQSGPRILHEVFTVEQATPESFEQLDVQNWPTWTTSDKEKWSVGNQVIDKVMPYGELSYMISGRLEIIPKSTGQAVVIEQGDFVTFPEGFIASWKVLEEVTWHYYLY